MILGPVIAQIAGIVIRIAPRLLGGIVAAFLSMSGIGGPFPHTLR